MPQCNIRQKPLQKSLAPLFSPCPGPGPVWTRAAFTLHTQRAGTGAVVPSWDLRRFRSWLYTTQLSGDLYQAHMWSWIKLMDLFCTQTSVNRFRAQRDPRPLSASDVRAGGTYSHQIRQHCDSRTYETDFCSVFPSLSNVPVRWDLTRIMSSSVWHVPPLNSPDLLLFDDHHVTTMKRSLIWQVLSSWTRPSLLGFL